MSPCTDATGPCQPVSLAARDAKSPTPDHPAQRVEGLGVGMGMLIGAAGLIGGLFYFIQRRKRLGSY